MDDRSMAASGLEAILAKDDTAIMLDWLQELFGPDIDVDSRFTIAQILTAMESAHARAVEFCQTVERAKATALTQQAETIERLNQLLKCAGDEMVNAIIEMPVGDRSPSFLINRKEALTIAERFRAALKDQQP